VYGLHDMSKVEQLEAEIAKLPPDQVWELDTWFEEYKSRLWDEQIKRDAQPGGPLDKLARRAIADFHAGRTTEMP
jgi:hypothetical protein